MPGNDLYTGTLDVIVLTALSNGVLHGYAIGSWIRKHSQEALAVREGVLYPALHRLERRNLVTARWGKTETGRRARFYSLTKAGRQHLETETKRLAEHSEAVLCLLRTSAG
ncbi:PadR family transcriptional regulator [Gemmatimonadota bacterium]